MIFISQVVNNGEGCQQTKIFKTLASLGSVILKL